MRKLLLISCLATMAIAQGKIGGVTYFDFSSSDDSTAFNFSRQYFNYGIDVSEDVQFNVVFDVGRTKNEKLYIWYVENGDSSKITEDSRLVVFLKKAQVDYSCSLGKSSLGLIGTNTYSVQEKNWGYRFIEKSAIDKNGFSSTADLGIGFSRNLMDQLNLSIQIVNGEGFKSAQSDKYHKIALNTTYGERNLIKNDGFNAGLVYTTEQTDGDPTTMTSLFGGFAGMGLRLGGEFDLLNKGNSEGQLISVSANYNILEKIAVFGRYDIFDEDTSVPNNEQKDLIAGIVLNCGSGLSVAPNLRMTTYEDDTQDSATEYKVNFQFKF